MKIYNSMIFLLFLPSLLFSTGSSFITQKEYASQLYKNPRGIGCYHCHGKRGEGRLIARYIHKGKEHSFRGPAINLLDIKTFSKALNEGKRGMPRYFLTKEEIQMLYLHVNITVDNKIEKEEIDEK